VKEEKRKVAVIKTCERRKTGGCRTCSGVLGSIEKETRRKGALETRAQALNQVSLRGKSQTGRKKS